MENTDAFILHQKADVRAEWFVLTGPSTWIGPVTADEVTIRLRSGEWTWTHFAWRSGLPGWKRLCDLKPLTHKAVDAPQQLPARGLLTQVKSAVKAARAREAKIKREEKAAAAAARAASKKARGKPKSKPVVKPSAALQPDPVADSRSVAQPVARAVTPPPAPPAPPAAAPKPAAPEISFKNWFLYYNDAQFGPFSQAEVQQLVRVRKIHGRVHAWCEGMENWIRLQEIPAYASLFKGAAAQTPAPATAAAPAKASSPSAAQNSQNAVERRSAPRKPLVAKIIVTHRDDVITGICRDISTGGMQVLTDQVPGPVGTQIRMNVSPAGFSTAPIEPFVAEGKIVRTLEDRRGFSFRFERLSESARKSIEQYLGSGPDA